MSLPYVENISALPALFERMRDRAPDRLYPDTLTATGFDVSEFPNVNRLLYYLNFYLPVGIDQPQHVSAFWKERYYQAADYRKALGWMLKRQYAFVYQRTANPMEPTKREVVAAIKDTTPIDDKQSAVTEKIAATFLALHRIADLDVKADHFGVWPDAYIISGVMPRDNAPPTLRSLIPTLSMSWWLVIALAIALCIALSR